MNAGKCRSGQDASDRRFVLRAVLAKGCCIHSDGTGKRPLCLRYRAVSHISSVEWVAVGSAFARHPDCVRPASLKGRSSVVSVTRSCHSTGGCRNVSCAELAAATMHDRRAAWTTPINSEHLLKEEAQKSRLGPLSAPGGSTADSLLPPVHRPRPRPGYGD